MDRKRLIDALMILLAPFLMAYSMVGEMLHEYIGIAMFVLFICHHIANRKWLASLNKGSWSAVRIFNTLMDLLLLVFMVIMMISALTISRYVFAFLNIGGSAVGRTLHLVGANWLFVLMSMHLGLHVTPISAAFRISGKTGPGRILAILFSTTAFYACFVVFKRGILSYMFLTKMFASFDLSEPLILFILDYLAIMDLFALIGYYLNRILIQVDKKRQEMAAGNNMDEAAKKRSRKKRRRIVLYLLGIILLTAGLLWGIPYMRRHYVTVRVNRSEATALKKVDLAGHTLIVQFTRTGNTDFAEDVDAVSSASLMLDEEGRLLGNSELLAEMIRASTGADLYAIRVAELYPSTYEATVNVADNEFRSSGYPELDTGIPLPDIQSYDRVILVFPLWWGTVPKAVEGFLLQEDFTDREVYLVLTHGGGRSGSVPKDLPAMLSGGRLNPNMLLVYDDDADEASDDVYKWLTTIE